MLWNGSKRNMMEQSIIDLYKIFKLNIHKLLYPGIYIDINSFVIFFEERKRFKINWEFSLARDFE